MVILEIKEEKEYDYDVHRPLEPYPSSSTDSPRRWWPAHCNAFAANRWGPSNYPNWGMAIVLWSLRNTSH